MSSDGNTGSRKPHYTQKYKDRIEELEAALERATTTPAATTSAPDVAIAEMAPPTITGGYDPTTDPLAFIDSDVDEVYLVGKAFTLPGWTQRRHRGLEIGKDVADMIKAIGQRKWVKNPFHYTGTYQQVKDLRTMTARHWYFVIDRSMVDYVYGFEKNPMPTKAIVETAGYLGVNPTTGQPSGAKTPCSDDSLREFIRYQLQLNPGSLWIDKAYFMDEDRLDTKRPNPYSDRYEMVGISISSEGTQNTITDALGDVVTD